MAPSVHNTIQSVSSFSDGSAVGSAVSISSSEKDSDIISEFFKDLLSDIIDLSPCNETLLSISSSILGDEPNRRNVTRTCSDSQNKSLLDTIEGRSMSTASECSGWSSMVKNVCSSVYEQFCGDDPQFPSGDEPTRSTIGQSDSTIQKDIEYCISELEKDEQLWKDTSTVGPASVSLDSLIGSSDSITPSVSALINSRESSHRALKLMHEILTRCDEPDILDELKLFEGLESNEETENFLQYALDVLKDEDSKVENIPRPSGLSLEKIEEQPEIDLELKKEICQHQNGILKQSPNCENPLPEKFSSEHAKHVTVANSPETIKEPKHGKEISKAETSKMTKFQKTNFNIVLDLPPVVNIPQKVIKSTTSISSFKTAEAPKSPKGAKPDLKKVAKTVVKNEMVPESHLQTFLKEISHIVYGSDSIEKMHKLGKKLTAENKRRIANSMVPKKPLRSKSKQSQTRKSPGSQKQRSKFSTVNHNPAKTIEIKKNIEKKIKNGKIKHEKGNTDSIVLPETQYFAKRLEIKNSKTNKRCKVKLVLSESKSEPKRSRTNQSNDTTRLQNLLQKPVKIPTTASLINCSEKNKAGRVGSKTKHDVKSVSSTMGSKKPISKEVIKPEEELSDLTQLSPYSIFLHHNIPDPINPKYVTSETKLLNSITAEAIKPISAEYSKQREGQSVDYSKQREESDKNYSKTSQQEIVSCMRNQLDKLANKLPTIDPNPKALRKDVSILQFNDILKLKILANTLTSYFRRSGRSFDTIVPLTVKYLYNKGRGLTKHQSHLWRHYNSKNYLHPQNVDDNYRSGTQSYLIDHIESPNEIPEKIYMNPGRKKESKSEFEQKSKHFNKLMNSGMDGANELISLQRLIKDEYRDSKLVDSDMNSLILEAGDNGSIYTDPDEIPDNEYGNLNRVDFFNVVDKFKTKEDTFNLIKQFLDESGSNVNNVNHGYVSSSICVA